MKNAPAVVDACDASRNCVVGVVLTLTDKIVKLGCIAVFTVPARRTLDCASARLMLVATTLLLPGGLSLPSPTQIG